MRRIARKTALIILSWAILNMGAFGWIKVYSASGRRAGSGISAMAKIDFQEEIGLTIAILGNEMRLNSRLVDSDRAKAFIAVTAEPVVIAAAASAALISGR